MREFMYDINSLAIAGVLFFSMVLTIEMGYRIGIGHHSIADESSKSHINAILGALLGILALLLGFTFSLSLQRYESRSEAVVHEANAIGTAILRAQLLPQEVRESSRSALSQYLDVRIETSRIALSSETHREQLLGVAADLHDQLWTLARQAAELNPNPVTTGLYIQALNDVIDALGSRDAQLHRHVPEVVLILLYVTFLMAALILGYTSGVAGHRASFVSYILVTLIVLLVFIIVDLDRPRRGLIEVSQESLIDLQAAIQQTDASVTAERSAGPEPLSD